MSRLAHAGDSNTRSPLRASDRHARTASGSVATRCTGTTPETAASTTAASLPSVTTWRTYFDTGSRNGVRSAFFASPPAISTMWRRVSPRPSSAATQAPRLVAFESLMYVTPSTTATVCDRCSSPLKSRNVGNQRSGVAAGRFRQRHRHERVELVVLAANAERLYVEISFTERGKVSRAAVFDNAPTVSRRGVQTDRYQPSDGFLRRGQRVRTVVNGYVTSLENALLAGGITGEIGISVQMVRRDVQIGRNRESSGVQPFELKTRQFENVRIAIRTEQIESRLSEIAAHPDVESGRAQQLARQCCDRALAVGAGNGHHRRRGVLREQARCRSPTGSPARVRPSTGNGMSAIPGSR